ncbi:hypothetical protein FACS189418_9140 [Clostridia bacterium]|nr:hypothetical protein FACS189418_9140 [Clostridia bacterium]
MAPNLGAMDGIGKIFGLNYHATLFGAPVIFPMNGYLSSVIPIIVAVWLAAKLEKWVKPRMHALVKTFLTPFIVLLIIVPITFIVLGPIMSAFSSFVSTAFDTIMGISPLLAGLVLGAVWQILVIFGLHWALVPIAILQIGTQGFTSVLSSTFAASFAQTAVVLAIFLKTKDKKLKSTALPAFISGIFGVTEPAIYGITLPRKRYFAISCIGAAVGGALIGWRNIKGYIMGGLGVFGFPSYINPETNDISGMLWTFFAVAVAMIVSFVLTMIDYRDDKGSVSVAQSGDNSTLKAQGEVKLSGKKIEVFSPLKGKTLALKDLADPAFSTGAMGLGVAQLLYKIRN